MDYSAADMTKIMKHDRDIYPLYCDIVYDKFIDKINGRKQIPIKELHEIVNDIIEELPEVPHYMVHWIIANHGWKTHYRINGASFINFKN